MIPLWKLKREVTRFGLQLRAIPEMFWEPVAQRRHDAAFARGFPLTLGAIPQRPKIAILLIWQPNGLLETTVETCRHLAGQGYAPFVISNAPLSDKDRAVLAGQVWQIMERPNFGYDFGGYRDGLRQLERMGAMPERLVILNDSIWFPLWPDDACLSRMEACDADMVGTVLRVRGQERFLESYFYSIPKSTLDHPGFKAFWRDLRLTSNKYKVIRRGERGFSAALRGAGLRLCGLFEDQEFLAWVKVADAAALRETLRFCATLDAGLRAEAQAQCGDDTPDFVPKARALILRILAKGQFYSSFPVAATKVMAYPVLKRSKDLTAVAWRAAFCQAVKAGVLPVPVGAVGAELRKVTGAD